VTGALLASTRPVTSTPPAKPSSWPPSRCTGTNVELQIARDESLLGGVIVEVGDLRLDASTKGRLGALHDVVMSGRVLESVLND